MQLQVELFGETFVPVGLKPNVFVVYNQLFHNNCYNQNQFHLP